MAVLLSAFLREGQRHRCGPMARSSPGIVQVVDEAHRVFENDSRYGGTMAAAFESVLREGRSADQGIILNLQNASRVRDFLRTQPVGRTDRCHG
jgi:DNA helicase HerA-like ATPase